MIYVDPGINVPTGNPDVLEVINYGVTVTGLGIALLGRPLIVTGSNNKVIGDHSVAPGGVNNMVS